MSILQRLSANELYKAVLKTRCWLMLPNVSHCTWTRCLSVIFSCCLPFLTVCFSLISVEKHSCLLVYACVCMWCISHDGTRNLPLYTTIGQQEAHSAPSCLWSSVTSWQVSDNSQNHLITLFAKNSSQQTKIIGQ